MNTHPSNALGRWEVHLPPHLPPNLRDLDFTLDSTKTDSKIGKKTTDEMRRILKKKYQWHTRDGGSKMKMEDRIKKRPQKISAFETNCADCGGVGHFNKSGSLCPLYTPPPTPPTPPTPPSPPTPSSPTVPGPGGVPLPPPPPGTHTITTSKTGDLIEVSGTKIVVNEDHPGFSDLDYWFITR